MNGRTPGRWRLELPPNPETPQQRDIVGGPEGDASVIATTNGFTPEPGAVGCGGDPLVNAAVLAGAGMMFDALELIASPLVADMAVVKEIARSAVESVERQAEATRG